MKMPTGLQAPARNHARGLVPMVRSAYYCAAEMLLNRWSHTIIMMAMPFIICVYSFDM